MESPKVLTAAEVAEISQKVREDFPFDLSRNFNRVFDSHELLRAENTRLRGLIEGMWHEAQCKSFHCRCIEGSNRVACTNQACCSCIRGKVNA